MTDFARRFPQAKEPIGTWYKQVKTCDTAAEIKERFPTASFVGKRVVFNISGNKYRIICKPEYKYKVMYIRFVGTHEEYDLTDPETV